MQNKQAAVGPAMLCNFWGGLSLFVSELQARRFFQAQLQHNPHFTQTHIAELSLLSVDGWADAVDRNGHFAFHEADTAVLFTAVCTSSAI